MSEDRTNLQACQRMEIGNTMTCHHVRGVTAKVNTAMLLLAASLQFLQMDVKSLLIHKVRPFHKLHRSTDGLILYFVVANPTWHVVSYDQTLIKSYLSLVDNE